MALMARCIRLWTEKDGQSYFQEGWIQGSVNPTSATFKSTEPHSSLSWHTAPRRQLVITLKGTLEFHTRTQGSFLIGPGDVLLAEDTTGGGHRWQLLGSDPWVRLYVVLEPDAEVGFMREMQ